MTAAELGSSVGAHERYVREWHPDARSGRPTALLAGDCNTPESKGCGGVISTDCEVGQAGTSTQVRLKGGALWLALAAAGARLPLMGLMTKTRLSALVTSPNWAQATHASRPGLAHPTNKNWRQS